MAQERAVLERLEPQRAGAGGADEALAVEREPAAACERRERLVRELALRQRAHVDGLAAAETVEPRPR